MKYKVMGYYLDKQQIEIIKDNSDNLLVIAGAGSGKTLTIIGKIKYLIENNIKPEEILCISFTNNTVNSLKNKIKKEISKNIDVYTFHKLSMNILNNNYDICDTNLLDDIVHKFLCTDVLNNELFMKYILIYNNINTINIKNNYLKYINSNEYIKLERLLITFIRLFKCNGYELKDFNKLLNKIKKTISYKKYREEKIFLILAMNIYIFYQKYLDDNNEIDFDDLIIKASNKVKTDGYKNTKYIIIDEYQDTSYIRFNLINNIKKRTNAKLMVVGDDYQSIYRFTGCDISLFINFNKYFNNSKILKIETTYRNSIELINIASKFVLKNKHQIKKEMISNKHIDNPIVFVLEKDFYKLIDSIKGNILILGRNNNDINKYDISKYNNVKYMTIHKSKGLEEDNVIIINLVDDILGFPSKIKEDKILRLVNIKEKHLEEERRLMYVALTRTKNKVYLIVPNNNKSIFIKEIKKIRK